MTIKEAKDKVSQDHGYESFNDFCRKQDFRLKIMVARAVESLMDEAAELYAHSKWGEAIEEAASLACVDNIGTDGEAYILNNKPEFKP